MKRASTFVEKKEKPRLHLIDLDMILVSLDAGTCIQVVELTRVEVPKMVASWLMEPS